jgi:hypothetical protein
MAAIESVAGDVRKQVDLLTGHMRTTIAGPGANTFPSTSDITTSIEATSAEILAWLASSGYSTDLGTWTAIALNYVAWYNALGAAYRLEMSHTGLLLSPTPGTRAETYYQMYLDFRQQILEDKIDLSDIGVGTTAESKGPRISQTGHTQSDKEDQEESTDAIQPWMRRGLYIDRSV